MTQAVLPWNVTTVNSYDLTASNVTLTTDDLLVNQIAVVTVALPNSLVTPTAAALKAAALPVLNSCFRFHILNADPGNSQLTMLPGTGVTILYPSGIISQVSGSIELIGRFTDVGGTPTVTIY